MPAGKDDDGVLVLLSDDDEPAPAPVDAEMQERLRRETEEFRRRRAAKKQRAQAQAASQAQPADLDMVDLTSDEPPRRNPAPAVVPPRQLPPYMLQRESGVLKNAAAAPRPSSDTAQALAEMRLAAIDHNNRMLPVAPRPGPAANTSHKLVVPYSARRDIDFEGNQNPYPGLHNRQRQHHGAHRGGQADREEAVMRAAQAKDEDDDQDVGISEKDAQKKTFCTYKCSEALDTKYGYKEHPDSIHETSSMSAVPTPVTKHKLVLPWRMLAEGRLTQVQIESVLHASAQHELRLPEGPRMGYFLGDGPGVGKGRQIGGMIAENHFRGDNNRTKALWLSLSADLIWDAKRDFRDLGLHKEIPCFDLKNYKVHEKLSDRQEISHGVFFLTYSLLVRSTKNNEIRRIDQIVDWCGGQKFHGIVALDECHRAKHMKQEKEGSGARAGVKFNEHGTTKSALFVFELQQLLPNARIVYVSATGATEPDHMQCFSRLGLWGPRTAFKESFDFVKSIKKGECGAMELVAMHMKASGQYLCRVLSFEGASFEIIRSELSGEFALMYDTAAKFWAKLIYERETVANHAKSMGIKTPMSSSLLWGAHQRFWMQMVIAAKVANVIEIAKKAEAEGKCVVIGLQSTGESVAGFVETDSLGDDVPSTATGIITWFIEKHCTEFAAQQAMLQDARDLKLPGNPLDELIDKLGGPERVAEMTGRKSRMVKRRGKWVQERRIKDSPDTVNIAERKKFQNGEKIFAIISEAASAGISLQADVRVANQRRRVHITLQLPWSADKAVQQMGRSHRSNQSSAPEFKLLLVNLGGEARFASAVANRLQSLGALTQGDRRAAGYSQDLVEFAIDGHHGLDALRQMIQVVFGLVVMPESDLADFKQLVANYPQFLRDAQDALKMCGLDPGQAKQDRSGQLLKTFLNRILGVPVQLQNQIFSLFSDLLQAHIRVAKANNTYDEGIVDIAATAVRIVSKRTLYVDKRSDAPTLLVQIQGDRGVSYGQALELLNEQLKGADASNKAGFYRKDRDPNEFMLVLRKQTVGQGKNRYIRVTAGTGHHYRDEHISDILKVWTKSKPEEAKASWERDYKHAETHCGHTERYAQCPGRMCTFKKRMKDYFMICGLVLPFWKVMKNVWMRDDKKIELNSETKVKVVRVQCSDGERVVGVLVPAAQVKFVEEQIEMGVPEPDHLINLAARISNDIFFEVMETFEVRNCMNPMGQDTFRFDLAQGWNKKNGKDLFVKMRAFSIPLSNGRDEEDGERDLEDIPFKSCRVTVNGVHMPIPKQPVPVDISPHLKVGSNEVIVTPYAERFIVSIQRGSLPALDQVRRIVPTMSNVDSKALLNKVIKQDEDVGCEDIEVSLRCPYGYIPIKTPARGKNCSHIQCFDLDTFLTVCMTRGSKKCLCCDKPLRLTDLRVCPLMKSVLEAAFERNEESRSVRLLKDGSFRELEADSQLKLREHQAPEAPPLPGIAQDKSKGKSKATGNEQEFEEVDLSGLKEEHQALVQKLLESGVWEYNKAVNERYEKWNAAEADKARADARAAGNKVEDIEVSDDDDDEVVADSDSAVLTKSDEMEDGSDSEVSTVEKAGSSRRSGTRSAADAARKRISYVDESDSDQEIDGESDSDDRAGPSGGHKSKRQSSSSGEGSAKPKRRRVRRALDSDDDDDDDDTFKSNTAQPARRSATSGAGSTSGSKGRGRGKGKGEATAVHDDDEDDDEDFEPMYEEWKPI